MSTKGRISKALAKFGLRIVNRGGVRYLDVTLKSTPVLRRRYPKMFPFG